MTDRAHDVVVLGGIGIDYLVKGDALPEQGGSAPGNGFVTTSARLAHAASVFATQKLGANASLATRDRLPPTNGAAPDDG